MLLNFTVPPRVLTPFIPRGTELDRFQGDAIVSMVGFLFADTRLYVVPVPGHRSFEEVNLRFYVTRRARGGERRRAVVFVREFVPRAAIAAVARFAYNEPYLAVPMAHETAIDPERGGSVCYAWQLRQGLLCHRCQRRRQRAPARARLRSGVHHRALLRVYESARRRDARVPRRAPALARLVHA